MPKTRADKTVLVPNDYSALLRAGLSRTCWSEDDRRMAMKRHDWQHHASCRSVDAARRLVIEDLEARNMIGNARGTNKEPGRKVRSKADLNRAMLETDW